MRNFRDALRAAAAVLLVCFPLMGGPAFAGGSKYERIEAIAQGQETQLGQRISVTIIIYELSTSDDQKALVDSFKSAGQDGLYNAVSKMKAHGHIAVSGTLGYDINYIREFQTPEGRKLHMVTDRPIRFGEAWYDTRSKDFNLSAFEITLSPAKGKSSGTLLPEMQVKVDQATGEVRLEAFKNPWKLLDIVDYPAK